jgi:hypothetical protein
MDSMPAVIPSLRRAMVAQNEPVIVIDEFASLLTMQNSTFETDKNKSFVTAFVTSYSIVPCWTNGSSRHVRQQWRRRASKQQDEQICLYPDYYVELRFQSVVTD